MNSTASDTLATESEVAKYLLVSVAALRRWRLEGRGPQYLKIGSLVRYKWSDVDAWLAARPTGGETLEHMQARMRPNARR